jgi:hypothetical protein
MEFLVQGLVGVICIIIVVFIGRIWNWIFSAATSISLQSENKKTEYLLNQYKNLLNTIDKDKKREIINIEVSKPSSFSPQWRVFKYVKSWNPIDQVGDKILIFTITDEDLSNKTEGA